MIFVESLMPDPMCRDVVLKQKSVYSNLSPPTLDIGCGTGFFTSKFKDAIGLDISKENITIAKKLLPTHSFVVAEASTLPFRNSSFNSIISMEVLEHIPRPEKTINEIRRCLRPSGKYLMSYDVVSVSAHFVRIIVQHLPTAHGHVETSLSDRRCCAFLDQKKLFKFLKGFNVIWVQKIRGLLMNMLQLFIIILEKITRPKRTIGKGMGMQHTRVNSFLARTYIKTIKLLVEKIAEKDPLKFDSSGVIILLSKSL